MWFSYEEEKEREKKRKNNKKMKKGKKKKKERRRGFFYSFSRGRNKVLSSSRENDFLQSLTVAEKLHFVNSVSTF